MLASLNMQIEKSLTFQKTLSFILINDITDDMFDTYKKSREMFGVSNPIAVEETLTMILGEIHNTQLQIKT